MQWVGNRPVLIVGAALIALIAALTPFYPFVGAAVMVAAVFAMLAQGRHFQRLALGFVLFVQIQSWLVLLATNFAAPLVPVVQRSEEFISLTLLFFVFMSKCMRPRDIKLLDTPLDLPLLYYAIFAVVSGIWNDNPIFITLLGLHDVTKNFLFFYIFRSLDYDRDRFMRHAKVVFFFAVCMSLLAFVEEFIPFQLTLPFGIGTDDFRVGIKRVTALSANPINLANLVSPFLFFVFMNSTKMRRKGFYLMLFSTVMLLCFSRQYWVAFIFTVVWVAWRFRGHFTRRRVFAMLFAGVFVIGVLGVLATVKTVKSKQYALVPPTDDSYFRTYALFKSLQIFGDHWGLGVGPGRFGGFVASSFYSPVYVKYNFQWVGRNSRNQIDLYWPQIWTEGGVLGILFYGWLLVAMYRCLKRMYLHFKTRDPVLADFTVTAIAYYLIIIIAGLASPAFSQASAVMIFFALAGGLYSLYEKSLEEKS